MIRQFIGTVACLLVATVAVAQNESTTKVYEALKKALDSGREVRIDLNTDDNEYLGKIDALTEAEVTITSKASSFTFQLSNIASVMIVDPGNKESRWFKNRTRNRLFITQTALSNGAGTGYYQNIYIFLSNISYSPTNFLTVSAGFSNIPRLTLDGDFFILSAKLNTPIAAGFNLGVSGTMFAVSKETAGYVNLLGTYTYKSLDLSAGLGAGVAEGETSEAVAVFGFQYRFGPRIALVTENFRIPGLDGVLYSFGPRFIGKRMSADLGLFGSTESEDAAFLVPYVSFSVAF